MSTKTSRKRLSLCIVEYIGVVGVAVRAWFGCGEGQKGCRAHVEEGHDVVIGSSAQGPVKESGGVRLKSRAELWRARAGACGGDNEFFRRRR